MVGLVAGQEIQVQAGLVEAPLLAAAESKNVPEQTFAPNALEEHVLARGALVGVSR